MTRAILVVLCVVLLVLALAGMRLGWRHRGERQAGLPPLPPVPADPGPARLQLTGLYVGTSTADSWQDRVVHDRLGERAAAVATLHDAGVLIDRQGAPAIFVPRAAWVGARLAPGLAGKVMGEGGLLVLRWRLGNADAGDSGGIELDTGLRADDKSVYPAWVAAMNHPIINDPAKGLSET